MLLEESHFIDLPKGKVHLKRIYKEEGGPAVFLLHGSMESGKIFYSSSMKGYAPYLAKQGYDVYIVDSLGRGKSKPYPQRNIQYSQTEVIMDEIPACLRKIREIRGADIQIHAGAHSWGGVLLLSYIARFKEEQFASMVFFGTKRSIEVFSWKKFIGVDVIWYAVGEIATKLFGYFPVKKLRLGSDDEFAGVYRQCRDWVYSLHTWIDQADGFDYMNALQERKDLPPTLYLAGINDHFLGHPHDVKRLMEEVKNPSDSLLVLSKENGFQLDYGHINMCTAKEALDDHFPKALDWIKRHETVLQA